MTSLGTIILTHYSSSCVPTGTADAKVADLSTQLADWSVGNFFIATMVDKALAVATQSSVPHDRLHCIRIILSRSIRFHNCILRWVSSRWLARRCGSVLLRGNSANGG